MSELVLPLIAIIVGFVLLMKSADVLVDNAAELALRLGVSTFLVGIVVIGFGTSAPEMFVSAMAALENKGNLAVGNALGSNITNIGLVLGVAALIRTIPVTRETAVAEIPMLILTGGLGAYFILDGTLTQLDGALLLVILITYLFWSAKSGHQPPGVEHLEEAHHSDASMSKLINLTILSIVVLVVASRILVFGAVSIATYFGVSDLVIGLTVIAIGTSLPELGAAIAAAKKGVHDMIVGNIIGSNIFNVLAVLGITGSIQATIVDTDVIWRDFPIMLAFTMFMLLGALTRGQFSRLQGGILLTGYIAYISYLATVSMS